MARHSLALHKEYVVLVWADKGRHELALMIVQTKTNFLVHGTLTRSNTESRNANPTLKKRHSVHFLFFVLKVVRQLIEFESLDSCKRRVNFLYLTDSCSCVNYY